MKLWTVWLDYFATGEGRIYLARVAYAETAEQARQGFEACFGTHYADGASVAEGMVRNSVTELLFSPHLIERLEDLTDRAAITLESCFHFNLS
jgi:hypothetical protein